MGLAYYAYESQAAWHAWPTVALFLCGDLAVGFLLLGAMSGEPVQNKAFTWVNVVLAVVAAAAFAVEGAHFAGLGLSLAPFVAAAVLALVAAALAFAAHKRQSAALIWAAFAAMFVAVVVARYLFYAVV